MDINLIFGKFPSLTTKRIELKSINNNDYKSLFYVNNDPDVVANINYGRIFDMEDCYETVINYYPKLFNEKQGIVWGMYLKPDNKLIGLRMCFFDDLNSEVTIQGQILREYRQMGYTLECYIEIIRFLKTAGVTKIKANCEKGNSPAIRLLEKLGFEKVFLGFPSSLAFSPNPNAILFSKDLRYENTKL